MLFFLSSSSSFVSLFLPLPACSVSLHAVSPVTKDDASLAFGGFEFQTQKTYPEGRMSELSTESGNSAVGEWTQMLQEQPPIDLSDTPVGQLSPSSPENLAQV